MCLIVEKRAQDRLEYSDVKDWATANPDGWGMMYVEREQVTVVKGFGFKKLWRTICQNSGRPYYLHLRMATHGKVKDGNTHPYLVANGVWLMHNGIVDIDCTSNAARSDTWHFIDQLIRPLLDDAADAGATIRSTWFRTMLESYMGPSNRIVIMDGAGAVTFNDTAWHTFSTSGMRVSNTYALGGHAQYDMDVAAYMGRFKVKSTDLKSYGNVYTWKDDGLSTKNDWERPDPWDKPENYGNGFDRTVEHDIAYLEQNDTVGILGFVTTEPERAADVLYDLLCS